MTICS